MRVLAFAFWVPLLLPVPQDALSDRIDALQARAPAFKDLELRYVARLSAEEEVVIGGETRLILIPGTGVRSDASILSLLGGDRKFTELEIHTTAVESGEDLYFRGAVHRGPSFLYSVIPPCISVKGRRRDYTASLDVFPAAFPFRWVADEGLALFAAAPKAAFVREPGWRFQGRESLEGRPVQVYALKIPQDGLPAGSVARMMPVSGIEKRLFVDEEMRRPVRLEFRMSVPRESIRAVSRVEAWKDVAGGAVPARIVTEYEQGGPAAWRPTELRIVKHLSVAWADRGLKEDAVLPPELRDGLHTDAVMNPTEFYREAARRAPGDPVPLAHLALARYRDAMKQAVESRRDPKVDPKEVIPDLERVWRLAPTASFAVLSLLQLYPAVGRPEDAVALAKAVGDHPVKSNAVRLALADFWVRQRDGAAALRQLEKVPIAADDPLRLRLTHGRLSLSALALKGDAPAAAKALREVLSSARAEERVVFLDALAPLPLRRGQGVKEPVPGLKEAVQSGGTSECLRRIRLRLAFFEKDGEEFDAALAETLNAKVDEPELEEAAILSLRLRADEKTIREPTAAALVEALPESPIAWTVRSLSLEGGEDACARALKLMASRPPEGHALVLRAEALRLLSETLAGGSREDLLRGAASEFIVCLNRSPRPYRLVRGGNRDPVSVCLAALLPKSKYVESFDLLKRLELRTLSYLYGLRNALRPHEARFFEEVRAHLEKTSKDPEDFLRLARLALRNRSRLDEALHLLEKAHALAPGDVAIAYELAETCERSGGRRERAIELYRALLAREDEGAKGQVDRDEALFRIGRLHHGAGRMAEAAEALDRLDLDARSLADSLMTVARIYEDAGAERRAIRAYRKYLEGDNLGYRLASSGVFARLGRLHEKRNEVEEAYAVYVRGVEAYRKVKERYGPTAVPRPPLRSGQVREETDPARLRDALLKRVGRDYFIERLLERKVPPLDPAARRKVKDLVERLRSDSIIDRDDALAELREMGPSAAPELREALRSTDPEFRARIRHLLWAWAEPK